MADGYPNGSSYGGGSGDNPYGASAYGQPSSGSYSSNPYQNGSDSYRQSPPPRRRGPYGGLPEESSRSPPPPRHPQPQHQQPPYKQPRPLYPTPSRNRDRERSNNSGQITNTSNNNSNNSYTARRRSRSRSTGAAPDGKAAQQIADVAKYVQQDWGFMTSDKCIPAQTALQLLDSSSLGLAHRYDEFQDAQYQLQSALRAIVNQHHHGFNSAIGTFHQIQASIQSSYHRIRTLKQSLIDAKSNLTDTKTEFSALSTNSHNYQNVLDLLATIERIQRIPEQLESRISEKRFLAAVESLQEGLRLIRDSQLDNVGALSETKVYISNQEHSLADILIEELHNHLYLKSPYCEHRWTTYAKIYGQAGHADRLDSPPRTLYDFLAHLDTSEPLSEDPSRNPEIDSFSYIYIIVESLAKLGRLDDATEAIEQRLPVELFRVVERSNSEVLQRHPNSSRFDWLHAAGDNLHSAMDDQDSRKTINDLLSTLYAKFEAIAESYRAFHEVIRGVARRESGHNIQRLTRSFRELWKLYQSQIRSLLHDYLSTDANSAQRFGQLAGEENVFRQQRDRSKQPHFKMDLVDTNDPDLRPEREEVIALWQKFVPGLVSLQQSNSAIAGGLAASSAPGQTQESGTGHKLLIQPSVFNITCLLPSSVLFLRRLKDLVPPTSDIVISTLSSFLNEFLINVFHPQLEEALTDYCSQGFIQLDAFQQDPQWHLYSQKPIFKGAVKFLDIITAFCKMLASLTHDQLFSQLVITQMNTFYDKCRGWYKALVSRAQATASGRVVKASALFAEGGDISDTVDKLWDKRHQDIGLLIQQETLQLIYTTKNHPLEESDLLLDRKTHAALCLLYNSMKWLALKLEALRHISPNATDATGMEEAEDQPRLKRSLTAALISNEQDPDTAPTYLPLSQGTASLFDGIISGYEDLATVALRTLHLELRCHIIQSLGESFTGSLLYSQPADAPNERMMKLVTDLLDMNQEIASQLQPQEYRFITSGASHLADSLVVHCTVHNLSGMNAHGSAHMQLNVRVLYHNLLNVEPSCDLPRSMSFFRLFDKGPDAIIAAARNEPESTFNKFSSKELEAMMKLSYSESTESPQGEVVMRAKKALDDKLASLSEACSATSRSANGPTAPSIYSFNSGPPPAYSSETATLASTAPPSYISRMEDTEKGGTE